MEDFVSLLSNKHKVWITPPVYLTRPISCFQFTMPKKMCSLILVCFFGVICFCFIYLLLLFFAHLIELKWLMGLLKVKKIWEWYLYIQLMTILFFYLFISLKQWREKKGRKMIRMSCEYEIKSCCKMVV